VEYLKRKNILVWNYGNNNINSILNKFEIQKYNSEKFTLEMMAVKNPAQLILRLSPSGQRMKMVVDGNCSLDIVADVLFCLDDIIIKCETQKTVDVSAQQSHSSNIASLASFGSSSSCSLSLSSSSVFIILTSETESSLSSVVVKVFFSSLDSHTSRLLGPRVLVKSAEPILDKLVSLVLKTKTKTTDDEEMIVVKNSQLFPNSVIHVNSDFSAGSVFEFLPDDLTLSTWWKEAKIN